MLINGSPARAPERAVVTEKDPDVSATVVTGYIAPAPERHLRQMLLATTVVAVLPLLVSLALRASGMVSGWVSVGLAVVMSLACSTAGSTYWRKRGGNTEVLFGELLLWGWIRSCRQERELANATRLLDLVNTGSPQHDPLDELTVEQREHLLQQLAGALEGQDVYLNGHSRRVARHATMIALGMGLPSEDVARIRAAAAVHDVGKLRTPKAILNKPGRLTDEEFAVIKRHPVDGAEMVAALGDPELTRIVRHHHERLDGAGYPDGLRGDEIPLGARIIAVADTFDAITSARPYRDAASHQKAIDILRIEAGTQLDPDAVRSFLTYYSGSRPTVVWAIITSALRRFVSWLTGDPAAAATISASKVAAATAATAAIGAAAAATPVPVLHHHAPARPVVSHAHASRVHSRGVAIGLRRQGVSVIVATTSATNGKQAAGASAGKTRRRGAHAAPARHRAQAQHAHSRAAGTATGTHRSTQSSGSTHDQSAGTPSVSGAAKPTPQRFASAPASQSQGANANGNAYGHGKPLGDGHGKGLAEGHRGSTSRPAAASNSGKASAPAATAPTPAANSNSRGSVSSASSVQGHGGGEASASAVAAPTADDAVSQGGQRDSGSQGNGGGLATGHGG